MANTWEKNFSKMDEREILANKEEKSFIFSSLYNIGLIIAVIMLAFFIGKIFFGTRSLEVLLNLQKQETKLKKTIKESENENAKLQKKLFEYQLTVPDDTSSDETPK